MRAMTPPMIASSTSGVTSTCLPVSDDSRAATASRSSFASGTAVVTVAWAMFSRSSVISWKAPWMPRARPSLPRSFSSRTRFIASALTAPSRPASTRRSFSGRGTRVPASTPATSARSTKSAIVRRSSLHAANASPSTARPKTASA